MQSSREGRESWFLYWKYILAFIYMSTFSVFYWAPFILWSGTLERSYGVEYWSGDKFWSQISEWQNSYSVYSMEWSLGAGFWSGVFEWSGVKFWSGKNPFSPFHNSAPRLHSIEYTVLFFASYVGGMACTEIQAKIHKVL